MFHFNEHILMANCIKCREFVGCVRCIRILSPKEVQEMSEEGMKLLNSAAALQGMHTTVS